MKITARLAEGTFVARDNRFRATVTLAGRRVAAHVPNSGRLHELFTPGRTVLLAPASAPQRRTDYDLVMVRLGSRLLSLDARLPGRLVEEAVRAGSLAEFAGYDQVDREVVFGSSRLDLRLRGKRGVCWVEAKSVTLVEEGTALFPDAVTARGRRHLGELSRAMASGDRAAVVFVVQRDDARCFAPHDESDPAFGAALREAAGAGVEVYAYACRVTESEVRIVRALPVVL